MAIEQAKLTLDSLKIALDIGSFLIKADSALDKALLKVELEKMIDALVEAKQAVRDLDEEIYAKDQTIRSLEEKLNLKGRICGYLGARYMINRQGDPTGQAFCPICYSRDHKLVPLSSPSSSLPIHVCGVCGNQIEERMAPLDVDNYILSNKHAAEKLGTNFEIKTYD